MSAWVISFPNDPLCRVHRRPISFHSNIFLLNLKSNRGERRASDTLSGYSKPFTWHASVTGGMFVWHQYKHVQSIPKVSASSTIEDLHRCLFSFHGRTLSITISQTTLATINMYLIFQQVRILTFHKSNMICFFRSTISEGGLNPSFSDLDMVSDNYEIIYTTEQRLNNTGDIKRCHAVTQSFSKEVATISVWVHTKRNTSQGEKAG